jgi:hypothetical protein
MPNIIITLLVDTTGLLNDHSKDPILKNYCTLAQLGGQLTDDPDNDLRNDVSHVYRDDTVTWNGASNSAWLPDGVTGVIVNILSITATTVFGTGQILPTQLIQGGTGGTSVQGQISFGSEGDTVTYTISFNIATMTGDNETTSQTYNIDPKIRIHQPH